MKETERGGGGRPPPPPRPASRPPAPFKGTGATKVIPPNPPAVRVVRSLMLVRRYVGRSGLIVALAALPVYYGVHDLVYGYQAGYMAGHAVYRHDLAQLGYDIAQGLSNGAIWALIAIGY